MATKIVRDFKFPNSSDNYRVNAEYLDGIDSSGFAKHEEGIHIINNCEGTTDTTNKISSWTGTSDCISTLYDGLRISYKIPVAGSTTTTLNINGLGAKTIYRFGTTKLTTHFAVNQIITLVYCADLNDGCWVTNDYDANTDTKVRYYKTTGSSYNKDYPVVFRYTDTNPSSSYIAEYARYDQDLNYTYNPYTNTLKVGSVIGSMSGKLHVGNQTYDGSTDVTLVPGDFGLSQALRFIGSSSTAITDGSTTATITLSDGSSVALDTNDTGVVVLYGDSEFVWLDNKWERLGRDSSFSLVGHTHTTNQITPAGSVSTPTITVTPNTTTVNSITGVGTLPSLTWTEKTASKITTWDDGTLPTASLSGGGITEQVSSGPNRHLKLTHTNPSLVFSAGTLPVLEYSSITADEVTGWSAGTLPTKGSNTTVVTGIKSATSSQPTFTGTPITVTVNASTN